jgi:DHA1 family bicyclomycin/chloramphenicol resistance-like MFS transporter
MQKTINHKLLIVILAALSSIAPISIDTYTPSLPMMAVGFGVGIEKMELTLTLFMFGFALGQLFGGPISDNIGRKKTSLLGLIGFSIFSFMIMYSSSLSEIYLLRIIEAFFGGLIVVNANAIARDLFSGQEAARVFTLIGIVRMIAPLIAPAIGAFIIHFYSWQHIFLFLSIYALILALMVQINIKETLVYVKQNVIKSYLSVLTHDKAKNLILLFGVIFAGAFIFISKAAFVYIEYFGVSTDWFPLFFGTDMIFIMIMARANIRLIKKYEIISVVKFGIFMQFLISIVLLFSLIYPNLWIIFILLTLYLGMLGMISGNLTALILEHFPNNSGTASATFGVLNVTIAGTVASTVTFFHDGTLWSVAIGIFTTSLIAYLLSSRSILK